MFGACGGNFKRRILATRRWVQGERMIDPTPTSPIGDPGSGVGA